MKQFFCLAIAAAAFLAACSSSDTKAPENAEPAPPKVSKHTAAFNSSFSALLSGYYELKDALVASDTAKANLAAAKMGAAADSVKLNEISNDSTGAIAATAADYTKTLSDLSKTLRSASDLEAKRKEFQMVSDAMYDLVRTVQYDEQVVYHQYCPMAFDNQGAYWLSNSSDIKNPYFGKKMLVCGEVKDSLNF